MPFDLNAVKKRLQQGAAAGPWTAKDVQALVEEMERLSKGVGYRQDALRAIFYATQEGDPEASRNHQLLKKIQQLAGDAI